MNRRILSAELNGNRYRRVFVGQEHPLTRVPLSPPSYVCLLQCLLFRSQPTCGFHAGEARAQEAGADSAKGGNRLGSQAHGPPSSGDLRWHGYKAIDKKIGYFCDIQHFYVITRIMVDNITPGHIRFLGIPYKFWNICINDIYSYNIT